MEIIYLGHSSFRIRTKTATLVTDPYLASMVGFKFPKTEADIVTVSHNHDDHNFVAGISGEPFVIDRPGEYEVKGVSVFGYPSFHDKKSGAERGENIIFVIEAEGLRICHLGDLGILPETKVMEEVAGVDVLMVPIGGVAVLNPGEAVEAIGKIEPLIVLPMHFRAEGVEDFLKEMGAEHAEKLDKLSLSKDKLPQETKVVILERKS